MSDRFRRLARQWLRERRLGEHHLEALEELLRKAAAKPRDRYAARRPYQRDYQRGRKHGLADQVAESPEEGAVGRPDYDRPAYQAGYSAGQERRSDG